jgi:hypothetical protein
MSTNQQERGDFAVTWHSFGLSGRWAWFEDAFKCKTCGGKLVEIRAEHAVMVCDPATDSVRVRGEPLSFIKIARDDPADWMLRIRQRYPLSVRCLETGVRNGKDQPASWFENPSYARKGGLEIRNIYQRHDTDTAGKLAIAKLLGTLSVSLNIHNSQWLLLFIALCEGQQVRCQVKAGDLRSASCQLACYPALPAGQITNDFPLDLSNER